MASSRDNLSRRDAIRMALGAFGCAALGPLDRLVAASPAPRGMRPAVAQQKFLVVVELDGGNDGLNMVAPVSLANYALRRPSLALQAGEIQALDSGPHATSDFALHGRMPRVAQLYRDGELGIVHKVGYPSANQSHDTSKLVWADGRRADLQIPDGWIGRYVDLAAPTSLGAIALRRGKHRSLAGSANNPLTVDALSAFKFTPDYSYQQNHLLRLEVIRGILDAQASSAPRDALQTGHALADQVTAAVAGYTGSGSYGAASIGAAMKDIATLLEAGFATRIFYTGFGGFDTHAGQGRLTGTQGNLFAALDDAIGGFADDCRAMGIWQNAVVLVISEFGRRNYENGSGGTDHGAANSVLVAGGAIQGGLHGAPPTDDDLAASVLPYGVDFRAVYASVLQGHLGLADAGQVFAEAYTSPNPVGLV